MKRILLLFVAVILVSFDNFAQCTITGTTVNASTLSCSSFAGCSTVYVGDGTNPTTIYMNANFDLTCLGTIQLVVRNNASIDFSPGNDHLYLADGSSIFFNPGANLVGGSCNASERIYIGANLLASCNGNAGADYSFADLLNFGGSGSLASNGPLCTGNTLNLIATPPPNGTYTYSFFGNGLPGGGTTYSSTNTYSLTAPATAGTYVYQVKMKSSLPGSPTALAEINVVINSGSAVLSPVVSLAHPDCVTDTGSITITAPTGSGYTYSINGFTYTNATVFSPLAAGTYSLTARSGAGCISPPKSATLNGPVTDTWNGSTWSTGSAPTSSQKIVFAGDFSSTADLTGCSLQVTSGTVKINSGHTVSITNAVKVTGGSLTFENTASLVQTNDASVNSGNITYKRKTSPLVQYDYTYWSAPVVGATLSQLATASLLFSFNPNVENWQYETLATVMTQGQGYIGRTPNNLTYSPTQILETSFSGVPGNGVINVPVIKSLGTHNLLGNPYPSAVDADLFIQANASVIDGTIYFWTHNTPITNYQYTKNDYAKYNYTGGVGTGIQAVTGGTIPTGKIGAGQGFFVEANTSLPVGNYTATFNNSMRVQAQNNQFFRTGQPAVVSTAAGLEKHRIWLSLRDNSGDGYNQMLLGYVQNASNNYDPKFDGKTMPVGNPLSIYTKVDGHNLSIQGRSLPFNEDDVVPIAYNTEISGALNIYLDVYDGNFVHQDIYLLDKTLNLLHNMKEGPYAFTTAAGKFEDRFELRFTPGEISSNAIVDQDVKVITTAHQLQIVSPATAIAKVEVYDLLGKLLLSENVETNFFQTGALHIAPQVVVVKMTLSDHRTIVRKTAVD